MKAQSWAWRNSKPHEKVEFVGRYCGITLALLLYAFACFAALCFNWGWMVVLLLLSAVAYLGAKWL